MFPVHSVEEDACTCHKENCSSPGKHPVTPNGVKDATNDLDQLTKWFRDDYPWANIGLATGEPSGVDVVDIDDGGKKVGAASWQTWCNEQSDYGRNPAGVIPRTLTSRTGGGGQHQFWRGVPGLRNRGGWLKNVDVRSTGGYVVLPPSDHASGQPYQWLSTDIAVSDMPASLTEALRTGNRTDRRGERLPDDRTILQGVPEGQRDDVLFRWACKLRRTLGDDRELIEHLVLSAAKESGFPRDQALRKVESAFAQDHADDNDNLGPDGLRLSAGGNAVRLAKRFGDQIVYVNGLGWHWWNGSVWVQGIETHMEQLGKAIIEDLYTLARTAGLKPIEAKAIFMFAKRTDDPAGIAEMLKMARSDTGLLRNAADLNPDPLMFTAKNGTVDLRTGDLLPVSRHDMITGRSDYAYDPACLTPRWDAFISWAMQGDMEMVGFLQRLAGYSITGLIRDHVFPVLIGNGRNGKNTFHDTITKILGTLAVGKLPTQAIAGRQTDDQLTAMMYGKRLAIVTETDKAAVLNSAIVKSYTGDEFQTGRLLYKDRFTFKSSAKLWMISNHRPEISDNSEGMWRRVLLINFNATVAAGDEVANLHDIMLAAEGPGIVAWLVRGAMQYLNGGLRVPASVRDRSKAYRKLQDNIGSFADECLVFDPNAFVSRQAVKESYTMFCEREDVDRHNRLKPMALIEDLGKRTPLDLERRGPHNERGIWGLGIRTGQFGQV